MSQTIQQMVDKWKRNTTSAGQSMKDGVNAVTVAPGQQAAQQKEKWVRRINEAQDKWASNVGAVSLQEWQRQMIDVGIPRVASGVTAAIPKVQQFFEQFIPVVQRNAAEVRAMPNATLEDAVQRAAAMIRKNAAFKFNRRRS